MAVFSVAGSWMLLSTLPAVKTAGYFDPARDQTSDQESRIIARAANHQVTKPNTNRQLLTAAEAILDRGDDQGSANCNGQALPPSDPCSIITVSEALAQRGAGGR